jgi:hypothetical protein
LGCSVESTVQSAPNHQRLPATIECAAGSKQALDPVTDYFMRHVFAAIE